MFGNYLNYYGYRSKNSVIDPRLTHLSPALFTDKNILDIGCNAGVMTLDLTLLFEPKSVVGIDLDPSLIRKANQSLYLRSSYLSPSSCDDKTDQDLILDYFPLSCSREIGILPYTSSLPVTFHTSDFMFAPTGPQYDTLLALSITKWIHLNHGDAGILSFFQKCYDSLKAGGSLVVEPQAWDTYKKKLSKELSETFNALQIRPEGFQEVLEKIGFRLVETIKGDAGFNRPLYVYAK
jgi:7SK snRNA methylphosphate capping enzyme